MIAPQFPLRPWYPSNLGITNIGGDNYQILLDPIFYEAALPGIAPTSLPVAMIGGLMTKAPVALLVQDGLSDYLHIEPEEIVTLGTSFRIIFQTELRDVGGILIIRPYEGLGWTDARGTACGGTRFNFRIPPED